ncbi:MAG: DNA topoisomerase, partial [Nitrososphaerales archaeon]|nr:DNA topoisomerase [Nitrososphaerales archaeon]
WNNLEKGLRWRWVYKALFRQTFDLITGSAFTRLLTGLTNKLISWGSCQTPTLYFIVEREREIMNFKPKKLWFIEAVLEGNLSVKSKIFYEREKVDKLYEGIKDASYALISSYSEFKSIKKRPLPLITDDLLRDFVKLSGITSSKVLNLAEELYSNGYISYPRTETNIYPKGFDFDKCLRAVLDSQIGKEVADKIVKLEPLNGRLDDRAHPPIHPLKPYPMDRSLKWKLWEYVARRFVANAYCKDALKVNQKVELVIEGIKFFSEGSYLLEEGFYRVFHYFKPDEDPLPRLKEGASIKVIEIKLREGETRPPSRMKEPELLSAMIKSHIGTDATRATFPQLIVERGYALKSGVFIPTKLGMGFIDVLEKVDKRLVTPETRRFVEELMGRIENGEIGIDEALEKSISIYKELYLKCESMKDDIKKSLLRCLEDGSGI